MKLYAPLYYQKFVCIAHKCRHSCCVGWEIDVDDDTLAEYAALTAPYGKEIQRSIGMEGTPHFRLLPNDRCPHLDERGLCRIITELGESYLCGICREHPRFYSDTPHGREVGLGLCCEEACRIILSAKDYRTVAEIGEVEGTPREGFDPLPHRRRIYDVLSDAALPYPERLQKITETYGVSPMKHTDGRWRELLTSLEYLDTAHQALFAAYTSDTKTPKDAEQPLERVLAYLVYRHCTEVQCEAELCAALGFALFCERLLCAMIKKGLGAPAELARILSEELEYSEENTEAIKEMFDMG